jgi:WbqC-like protein family
MQPYFFPYAGYFRLFAAVDMFVVLDCVQFPRRGWVHRNKLKDREGNSQWLTLPLVKGDRETLRICDLQFQPNARDVMLEQFRRFPILDKAETTCPQLFAALCKLEQTPVDYLCTTLSAVLALLGIERPMLRSSTFNLPPELRAQDRIIDIAKRLGACHYINAPGGKSIYESGGFASANLTLNFLPEYVGSFDSVLQRLLSEPAADIAEEVWQSSKLEQTLA